MLVKVSFVAAASLAAFAVSKIKIEFSRKPNTPLIKPAENDDSSFQQEGVEEDEKEKSANSEFPVDGDEEAKRSVPGRRDGGDSKDVTDQKVILQNMVERMERRSMTLEGKLLEMYCLEEKNSYIAELQRELKVKAAEADILSNNVKSLQAETKKLGGEIKDGMVVDKQLDIAKNRIKELHEKMSGDWNWVRRKLVMLAERVSSLEKEGTSSRDHENGGKKIRDVALEILEMKRKNRELEMERRELRVTLVDAEAKAAQLSNMTTQVKMKAKLEEEANSLRRANEILSTRIENLQKNRVGMVEELVYQRWLNTCLRLEAENHKAQSNKFTSKHRDSSQESHDKALTPFPDHNSYSTSYSTSSIESGETDDTTTIDTIDSPSSSQTSTGKKYSLIQNRKRWGRCNSHWSIAVSSPGPGQSHKENSPYKAAIIRRLSMPDVPLYTSTQNNEDDRMGAVITPTRKERVQFCTELQQVPSGFLRRRRVSFNDSIDTAASPFEDVCDKKKGSHCSGSDEVEIGHRKELNSKMMLTLVDDKTPVARLVVAFFLFLLMLPVYFVLLNAGVC